MATPEMYRAVLTNEVSRDDIDDAMAGCDLHLTNVLPGAADVPAQLMYVADHATHLYVIEDNRLGVVYVAAAGPNAPQLLAQVEERLPSMGEAHLSQLDSLLDGDPAPTANDVSAAEATAEATADTIGRGLAASVLTAPNAATTGRIRRALGHADRAVRHAALVATTYAEVRPHYSALVKIRDEDEDVELRAEAARVLDSL